MNIFSELHKGVGGGPNEVLIKVAIDKAFFDALDTGNLGHIGHQIAVKIADEIYPEARKMIMSDPTMKDRVINDVLLILAGKIVKDAVGKVGEEKSS